MSQKPWLIPLSGHTACCYPTVTSVNYMEDSASLVTLNTCYDAQLCHKRTPEGNFVLLLPETVNVKMRCRTQGSPPASRMLIRLGTSFN